MTKGQKVIVDKPKSSAVKPLPLVVSKPKVLKNLRTKKFPTYEELSKLSKEQLKDQLKQIEKDYSLVFRQCNLIKFTISEIERKEAYNILQSWKFTPYKDEERIISSMFRPDVKVKNRVVRSYEFPAGQYYVGDLIYALEADLFELVQKGNGLYQKSVSEFFLIDSISSWYNNDNNDDTVKDSTGKKYNVYYGTIGICPLSLVEDMNCEEKGHILTFSDPVKCKFAYGRFQFTVNKDESFYIETNSTRNGSTEYETEEEYEDF